MKPITGSVVSSKPVSLSKAASILTRFAASETGAHQDVSAFLRRSVEAFDELVKFHRDLGTGLESDLSSFKGGEEGESRKKKKKKRRREEADVEAAQDHIAAQDNAGPSEGLLQQRCDLDFLYPKGSKSGSREEEEEEEKKKKKKKKKKKTVDKEIDGRVSNVLEIEGEERDGGEDKRKEVDDPEEVRQSEGNVESHRERRQRKEKRKKM